MNSQRVTYIPRRDATPEGEIAALALVYSFALECAEMRGSREKKEARPDRTPHRKDRTGQNLS